MNVNFGRNVDASIMDEMDQLANEQKLANSVAKFGKKTNLVNMARKKVVYLPIPPRPLKMDEKSIQTKKMKKNTKSTSNKNNMKSKI
jgi:hypothetical protein